MHTGHSDSVAIRHVELNNDGTWYLRLWEIELGTVPGKYSNWCVPYIVKFYPHDDNIFVFSCSDNKIVSYDATMGDIKQEYDPHLAPVNATTLLRAMEPKSSH
jgi:pre-mRNA-processing factor 17